MLALGCCALLGARGDAVVLRVGPDQVTVQELEQQLAALPRFQRDALGPAPQLARRIVDQVLTRELLLTAEARSRGLERTATVQSRTTAILRDALVSQLRAEIATQRPVTAEQVKAYYEQHRDQFQTPQRIRIWRILVRDEDAARRIIASARALDGPAQWSELARQQSLDKATAMRKGDLGFVRPDGTTDVPRVHVDAELYAAAARVADGQVVPDPVPEGKHLAVVWRRGTRAATNRSLGEARAWIEEALMRERHQQELQRLLDELRNRHVKHHDPSALEDLDALPVREVRQLPPPVVSARAARRPPTPDGPRGLR